MTLEDLPCGCAKKGKKFVGYNFFCSKHPRFSRLRYWFYFPRRVKNSIRGFRNHRRWGRQRVKRGYSDLDWWNLNTFLCDVIIGGVQQLRDNGHAVPMRQNEDAKYDWEALPVEEWNAILTEIEEGFAAAKKLYDYDYTSQEEADALEEKFNKGGALFIEWFHALWD